MNSAETILPTYIFIAYIIIVIFGFVYYFLGSFVFRPFRSNKMRKLSTELGLTFTRSENQSFKDKLFKYSKKKNIIKGVYNGKKIIIYDYDTVTNFRWKKGQPHIYGNDPKKLTCINGKYYKSFFLPYLSVNQIKKMVKEEITLKEYTNLGLNTGVFLVIFILGIFISWIAYCFFIDSLSSLLLIILVLIVNIIFIALAYLIAKKTGYKLLIE